MFNNFFQRKYLSCKKKHLLDELNNHYNAAKRLDIILIGTNYDVFAADVYYHKACYGRFIYECQQKTTITFFNEATVLHYLLHKFELKVIKDHEAFLANELMQYWIYCYIIVIILLY